MTVTPVYVATVATPAGDARVAVDGDGVVVGLEFVEGTYPRAMVEDLRRDGYDPMVDGARTASICTAIAAYTHGTTMSFDVAVKWDLGTPWQATVWRALQTIPVGEAWTYAGLASSIGRPTAVRAVARANATNRVPLIVPCHRVIGADGTLTGFAGGLHLKARLLDHERRVLGLPEVWQAWH